MPDPDVLNLATASGQALITPNRKHFIQLHATVQQHAGIIVCTFEADSVALAVRIHAVLLEGEISGRLIRVNRPQA